MGRTNCSEASVRISVWQQQATLTLAAKKHSCGAPTASMHSQVDSTTEHFLRKVLLSLMSLTLLSLLQNEAHCKVEVLQKRIPCSKKHILEKLQIFVFYPSWNDCPSFPIPTPLHHLLLTMTFTVC